MNRQIDPALAPTLAGPLAKFADPDWTAKGEPRAKVTLTALETLWFNTGTLCNIECRHCYILSSPTNDALVYLTLAEVETYLAEIAALGLPTREIGFTGGEPFMNPDLIAMAQAALERGHRVLILTNAMRPMMRPSVRRGLAGLAGRFGERLVLRASLDHYTPERHDAERGQGGFATTLAGMRWLRDAGLRMTVAGRTIWGEDEAAARAGYAALFAREGFAIDAANPAECVLFPEMDERAQVPEITTACWGILGKSPDSVMCASARMVVKRRGAARPVVLACTLLAYDPRFELGATLAEATSGPGGEVALNHPHCAKFCVLGGASCSG
ncbi:MAG: radical SAM protein [Thermohalobaculum sp.]